MTIVRLQIAIAVMLEICVLTDRSALQNGMEKKILLLACKDVMLLFSNTN